MISKRDRTIGNHIKITSFVALGIIVTAISFGVGTRVGAASGDPGSMTDPLITESFLEQRLSGISGGAYSCISVDKGKNHTLSAGDRFVLYSGEATAKGSLIDLTEGTMLKSGGMIQRYHEYLVPSDDSGIKMSSSGLVFSTK